MKIQELDGGFCQCAEEPARPLRTVPSLRSRQALKDTRIRRAGALAHGFTLIEVLVALTIASVVVLAAHRIFTGVTDGAKAIRNAREDLDRRANARRWLKATFLSLEPPFEGRPDRASFTAWQLTSGGWLEPQPIVLEQEGMHFFGKQGGETLRLADDVTSLTFDYLLEPGADTKWVREWISPVSAPLAVRVRIAGCGKRDAGCVDTLLFLVKERG